VNLAVVAADPELYERTYADPGLLHEYDREVKIYRTGALFGAFLRKQRDLSVALGGQHLSVWSPNRWKKLAKSLLVPDEYVFWVAKSVGAATRAARAEGVDLILVTAPPFSAFLLASLVARRIRKPLVLDYRDLWTPNVFYSVGHATRNLERRIVNQASHLIVTNEPARETMMRNFRLHANQISVIPNGFEGDMLEQIIDPRSSTTSETFRMNYIGSLTAGRTPQYFLAAIHRLLAARPRLNLSIGVVGFTPAVHKELVDRMGLGRVVQFAAPVPRRRALEIMCNESDLLVLLQRGSEGGDFAIPGKLYEYLGSSTPFIAMDERGGATARFLAQIGAPEAIEYEDVDGISNRLINIIDDYQGVRDEFSALRRKVSGYDRRHQAAELAHLLAATTSRTK